MTLLSKTLILIVIFWIQVVQEVKRTFWGQNDSGNWFANRKGGRGHSCVFLTQMIVCSENSTASAWSAVTFCKCQLRHCVPIGLERGNHLVTLQKIRQEAKLWAATRLHKFCNSLIFGLVKFSPVIGAVKLKCFLFCERLNTWRFRWSLFRTLLGSLWWRYPALVDL